MSERTATGLILRGRAANEAGDPAGALKAFQAALAIAPENSEALLLLATAEYDLNHYAETARLAGAAMALDLSRPRRSWAMRLAAVAALARNQTGKSFEIAHEAVAFDPLDPANHCLLGRVLWQQRKTKKAEAAYREALRLAPEDVPSLLGFARFLVALTRYREAHELIGRAAAIAPDQTDVLIARAQSAFRMDHIAEARDLALWVLARAATNPEALMVLAKVRSRQNWFTAPFWWAFSWWTARASPWGRKVSFVGFLTVLVALMIALDPTPDDNSNWPAEVVYGTLVAYCAAAGGHVVLLLWRERRRVRLRQDY
ncbi:tetratricopeptide repeat protein [Acidocella sp.]|uniref:tetratricopeptide repeat protein n=1 Tax=Acidocella sp. TaxID=50710 RepID=UPI00260DBFF6|nr:tetratricopeptide repeat protein [Acidocella sp.]